MSLLPSPLPPLPLPQAAWERIAAELRLRGKLKSIAEMILRDQGDKQIEIYLGIAHGTLRTYMKRLFERLGTASRTGVVIRILSQASHLLPCCQPPG